MKEIENVLPRPLSFDGYIRDAALKTRLLEQIQAAKARGVLPPHLLFSGQVGTGKTTLATLIAKTLELPIFRFVGCELKKPAQLKELLKIPDCGALLFISEIHAVSREMAEVLGRIMEDREFSSPTDAALTLYLNPVIVIGASTESDSLAETLFNKFALKFVLPRYTDLEMLEIVKGLAARISSAAYSSEALSVIASRSKNIPHIAGRLVFQVNDSAMAGNISSISCGFAEEVLERCGISKDGFDGTDRKIVERLLEYNVLGLNTLSSLVGEAPESIAKVYEPYLRQKGYLQRTPKGLTLTAQGRDLKF